ncbi:MAG: Recombinase, partial [Candidatus Berkelbacteria bacterium]|nr:Recombinase [Candidatus Berkelbacteria bacterium]
ELQEFNEMKNELVEQKKSIEEKLNDFERKGNQPLELLKNWIFEANQAGNLVKTKKFLGMRNFLKTVGSNRRILSKSLLIDFQKPYDLLYKLPAEARAAGEGEAHQNKLNSLWWTRADSNRGPPPCHGGILPLNYGPSGQSPLGGALIHFGCPKYSYALWDIMIFLFLISLSI